MNLSVVTPTCRRWVHILEQAPVLAPQLRDDDKWIIVIDNDQTPMSVINKLNDTIGIEKLVWAQLSYLRPIPPVNRVNHARNVGAAMAPGGHHLVELDDHDLIEKYTLDEVRAAFDAGWDYVFGNYKQRAIIHGHPSGKAMVEPWPDVKRSYLPGGFSRNDTGTDGIGLRAVRRELWNSLGGWRTDVWPQADKDFAIRAEAHGARIVCLDLPLCTVTIDPDSLSGEYRGANPQLLECAP